MRILTTDQTRKEEEMSVESAIEALTDWMKEWERSWLLQTNKDNEVEDYLVDCWSGWLFEWIGFLTEWLCGWGWNCIWTSLYALIIHPDSQKVSQKDRRNEWRNREIWLNSIEKTERKSTNPTNWATCSDELSAIKRDEIDDNAMRKKGEKRRRRQWRMEKTKIA
jgi:hypothetical protein